MIFQPQGYKISHISGWWRYGFPTTGVQIISHKWLNQGMKNRPNGSHSVGPWCAFPTIFKHFTPIWPIFLTFRALFTCLDAFSNTVNHLQPLEHVFQSFPAFLCPHIIPQLPQPFPNPCSHFQPLSLISTCFRPISTDLGSHDEPTHLYDLPWPFSSPTVHFWSHTLIPDPKPHFQPFLHFPNRYHMFLCVYEFGQPPTSTWTHSKVSTHIFETVRAFSTHFRLFLTIFNHFGSFLPVPFATFKLYYIPTLTPYLSHYLPPIFKSCHPFFNSFLSIFIILDHFHLF